MNGITIAIIVVTGVGALCAVILAVASKFMEVKVDERITAVRECLPGANCGACGYAGCDGYAEAVVEGGAKTNLCIPGGADAAKAISSLMGAEFEETAKPVAVVRCKGESFDDKMRYVGIDSCAAAKALFGGSHLCTFGCLGYGDCISVCSNEAIYIKDGRAVIDTNLCVGCGLCVGVCPNNVIAVVPSTTAHTVMCVNTLRGADTRKQCSKGCIGCMMCVKNCPEGAITVTNNVASIDPEKCTNCGKCAEVCPTKCIGETMCPLK